MAVNGKKGKKATAKDKTFSVIYEELPGRPTLPITGAYGGLSADGSSVVAHVYVEFGTLPSLEEHQPDAQGKIRLDKGTKVQRSNVTRRVVASLIFTPESAHRMGVWLQDKSKKAVQARQENPVP